MRKIKGQLQEHLSNTEGVLKYRDSRGLHEIECTMVRCVKKGEHYFMTYKPIFTQRDISACFWAKEVLFVAKNKVLECTI